MLSPLFAVLLLNAAVGRERVSDVESVDRSGQAASSKDSDESDDPSPLDTVHAKAVLLIVVLGLAALIALATRT